MNAARTKTKQATIEITREVFRRMPALLSRAAFLEVTGLDSRVLSGLVKAGEVSVWRWGSCKYGKYKKVDAARLAGLETWLE